MFEVLAFVYENYWRGDACPARPALQRKLSAVGFDDTEVQLALVWLEELRHATHHLPSQTTHAPGEGAITANGTATAAFAMRTLTTAEQARLGRAGWGLVLFLVSAGVLPWERLELVMERAMAATVDELSVDDLKLIVLMVFWSLGEEPDALVLDELCDSCTGRIGH
jgi:Smg protein